MSEIVVNISSAGCAATGVTLIQGPAGPTGPAGGPIDSLAKSANLSDLTNAGTARNNLGLGSAAVQPANAFDASGAAAAAQAAAIAACPAETATTLGALISGATAKTTPVDPDTLGLSDSAASNVLKKLTWANAKATLKTYFDSLYQAAGSYVTPGGALGTPSSGNLANCTGAVDARIPTSGNTVGNVPAFTSTDGQLGASPISVNGNDTSLAGKLIFPTVYSSAKFTFKTYDGGEDVCLIGYNLGNTLYTPQVNTEPQIWMGIETNYANNAARDPAFGTHPTGEMYWRYQGVGLTGANYLEPLFFNFDRTLNKIIRADMRAERITLSSTNDGSSLPYVEMTLAGAAFYQYTTNPSVGIGKAPEAGIILDVQDVSPVVRYTAATSTNPVRIRLSNDSSYAEFGRDNQYGYAVFGAGVLPYSLVFKQNGSGAIVFGHTDPELTVLSGGNTGIKTNAPTVDFDINGNTARLRSSKTPASSSAAGNAGEMCWDSAYLYICTATNTWRRIAHATW